MSAIAEIRQGQESIEIQKDYLNTPVLM